MKENKAYVVTAGEYSDYRIEGIFSSREKAEEYINHSPDKNLNGIDEWVLDKKKPNKREKIFKVTSSFDKIDFHISGEEHYSIEYKDLMQYYIEWNRSHNIHFYIYTDTRERAIKIASERLRQVKAEEYFRYPLLRRPCYEYYTNQIYPTIHYHTGEIVWEEGCSHKFNDIPEDLKPKLKVVTMEELKERYKDLNNKEELK